MPRGRQLNKHLFVETSFDGCRAASGWSSFCNSSTALRAANLSSPSQPEEEEDSGLGFGLIL